ncbi:hypothetical protein MPTK1_6g04640 [Marchantia polymorpha subsp. ruderalis]|uniref:Uncharacterized protein n=2 Tax=Marchantia polymorpha TaxID=3197 RepID=A0AAF6BNI0_MARPO|nr:hypothetical protein MARPO_0034s0054 [Marchantia polymorpha]BBN13564.1 hypothetical protein Mp_6g04640 [Marchantia polymorpha subsp. ruderalis]|eukprot:PTQ41467.1 hypothetical protein MARPO_0034s0054 [Marchantia polymorpha]
MEGRTSDRVASPTHFRPSCVGFSTSRPGAVWPSDYSMHSVALVVRGKQPSLCKIRTVCQCLLDCPGTRKLQYFFE